MSVQREVQYGAQTSHFAFDRNVTPVAQANSGDTVIFHCQDCYDGQITHDGMDFARLDVTRTNPVTGPLYIAGAEPGDVLKVEIQRIEIADYGVMCVKDGWGICAVEGSHCRRFPIRDGKILFDGGLKLPVRPMIGVIGTAPATGTISTQTPGEHGGNMDICELGEGCTIYLPVAVSGALLSMGDLHGVQGDGESASCAMETSGRVTVRVTVQKAAADLPTPMIETDRTYCTTAADASLDVCSVTAAQKMHRWLMSRWDMTDAQAAMLLSLQGNLRISQVVNPRKGCMMELKKELLAQWKISQT